MKEEEVALETIENQTAHSLGYYLKQPIILVTAFAFFCYNYILFFFLSWFPSYLVQQHHLDIKQMSLTTMIPWIVGFVGLALGGYISDKIFKLTGRLLLSRKIVLVVCLLMAAICVGLAGTVSSVVPAVLLMSVSIFFLYVTGAIYWAIIQDVVHKSRVGGASGFIHLIGSVSGIVGPIVTGYIVQSTGKFDSAFVLAGTIAALGALLVLFVIKTPRVTMKASRGINGRSAMSGIVPDIALVLLTQPGEQPSYGPAPSPERPADSDNDPVQPCRSSDFHTTAAPTAWADGRWRKYGGRSPPAAYGGSSLQR